MRRRGLSPVRRARPRLRVLLFAAAAALTACEAPTSTPPLEALPRPDGDFFERTALGVLATDPANEVTVLLSDWAVTPDQEPADMLGPRIIVDAEHFHWVGPSGLLPADPDRLGWGRTVRIWPGDPASAMRAQEVWIMP